ncbi:MAG: PAS domain S-box protein, partial [Candidatus Saliniplasma sp.]
MELRVDMEEIKILFVDDEPGILDQAKIFLEREDERFDIITSNSASQALKLLDKQGFDVIVSDYQMPDIDGLEFLEEIRNVRGDDIPFIMFTGRGREEVAMRALNLGADRYMQKGGDPKSQYGVLAQAIAQESMHYRTETSLKKKNELLTQIFERSEEGFYIRDISGKLTFVNESFADIHGYSQDELIDKESRSFLTDESKKQVEKLGIDDLVDRWVDIEIETKSGQKKTLQNAIFPLRDEDGEIQEIFGIVNDITDKVEAEERLELALEGTKAGIWDWNIQTGELVVDERYVGIVGYELEELEPVSFETWKELAHPQDLKRSNELLEKHFAGETDIYEFEGRMKHKDGHWVWVLDRGKVMEWDENGDPLRMTGTHTDISKKKEYEELAKEMYSLRSAIREINQHIVQEDDFEVILQKTCKTLKDFRDYMDVSIAIRRKDDKIVPIAHHGDHERKLWSLKPGEDEDVPSCIEEVQKTGEIHIIEEVDKECGGCGFCEHTENHRSILVPMLKEGRVNGVLSACVPSEKEIADEEIELLKEVSVDLAFARDKMVAEEELEKKRRLLEKTEEISDVGGWEYDVENDEMYWTDNLFELHGFSRRIKRGYIERSLEFYPPEVKEEVKKAFERAVEEGETYDLEVPFVNAQGKEMWVRTLGEPIIEDGKVVKVVGNLMDITERKRKEEALRESEERYKNLFYKTPLGTIHYDDKGVITDCNERFVELIGSSKEVLIGLNMLENLEDEELIKEVRRSLENGEGYYEGYYTSITAGKTTPVRVLFKGIKDEDDDIYAGIGLVEDITERKKAEDEIKTSEERYRRLFETAQDGMLILDGETGEIKDANPYILELIGYSKEELVGKELWEIGTFRNIAENREKFQELVDEGYVRYEDLPLKTKSGEKIPVEFVSNTYMVSDKRVAQCNIRSIKDRHEREKELDLLYKILRYSQEEDTDIEDILEKTAQLVPESFQWPEYAVCKIELDNKEYKSERFEGSEHRLGNDIVVDGDIRGSIVVHYTEKRPEQDIGPFLNQENALIEGVADILGMVIHKREIEERSRMHARLLDHIRSAVIYTDIDGKVTYWNKGAEDLYGWEAEEVICKNIVDITPSLMNKDQAEEIMRELQQGNEWSGEFTLKKKDGSEFDAWVVDSPVLDKNGELKGIIGISYDISEQKKTERKLEKSKDEIKGLYELSSKLQNCETEKGVFQIAIEAVDEIFQFDIAAIIMEEDGKGIVKASTSKVSEELGYRTELDRGIVGLSFREKQPYLITDIDEFHKAEPKTRKYKSGITVPIGDTGVFQAVSEAINDFDESDLEVAQLFISHIKETLDRIEREEELQKSKGRIEKLHDVVAGFEKCETEDEIYSLAMHAAEEILDFDICGFDAVENDRFVIKAISSELPEKGSIERHIKEGGLDTKTYKTQRSYLVDDLKKSKDAKPVRSEYRSAISVPIGKKGVFQAVSTEPDHFDEEDLKMAELLIKHVREALERVKMGEKEKFLHALLRHDVGNKVQIIDGYLDLIDDEFELPEKGRKYLQKARKGVAGSIDLIDKV